MRVEGAALVACVDEVEGGYWKGIKMPFVASEACWRKTVELEEASALVGVVGI